MKHAALVLSKSTLQQALLKESVKTALIRMREIEAITKKVVSLTEVRLNDQKSQIRGSDINGRQADET